MWVFQLLKISIGCLIALRTIIVVVKTPKLLWSFQLIDVNCLDSFSLWSVVVTYVGYPVLSIVPLLMPLWRNFVRTLNEFFLTRCYSDSWGDLQLQSNSGILALEIVLGFSKEIVLVKKVDIVVSDCSDDMNLWLIKPFKFK